MGNCLILQERVIKVMKTDGKVLEYKAPMKVHQVLSDFSGHAVSDTLSILRHLRPDDELLGGHFYYLLPLPVTPPREPKKKKVRFSDPVVEDGKEKGPVRIKLVITKQELEVMLSKGGVSIDDLISQSQLPKKKSMNDEYDSDCVQNGDCQVCKPFLESIPEVN